MLAKLPLRQRKKDKAAKTIEEVATELFARQGYDATTLEQIAEAAEVHKQTVLRYFNTKEDIAFASRNRLFQEFKKGLSKREGSVLDYWRSYVAEGAQRSMLARRRWVKFVDSDDRLFAYQLHLNQKYIDVLADALSAEAGVDPLCDVFARCVAAMLVAGNYDVARMALRAGGDMFELIPGVIDLAESLRRETIAKGSAKRPAIIAAPGQQRRRASRS
jgi:AcrR family transcriptional regulator